MKKVIMIILALLLAASCCFVVIRYRNLGKITKQEKSELEHTVKKDTEENVDLNATLDQYKSAYDGTEDVAFLQSIKKVADEMVDSEFEYNTSKIGKSLKEAKETNLHGDCAHLICWALQDMGVLTKKQTFYSKKKGVLSCKKDGEVYKNLSEHASIIEIDPIKGSNQEELKKVLKVGDICCYSVHMNVVAGIDKKGNIIYYDGGLTPVENHKAKNKYNDLLRRPYSRPNMKNTLYTIIRLEDGR